MMPVRAILATLLLASVARGEVKNLNGQPAPELGKLEQAGGIDRVESLAALRGRAVLLAFFDSSYAACDRDAPKLEELFKAHRERGLVVVGVSAEPLEKLRAFVEKHATSYPIVSSPGAVKAYEVDGYPTKYLIAPSGKVVASENSNVTTAMIEEQLATAVAYPLREYSKKFDACLAALKTKDLPKAAAELAKLEKEEGADGENARALVAWIEETGERRLAAADAAREQGEVFLARDLLAEVDGKFPPKYSCTKAAGEKLKALRADKEARKVLSLENDWKLALAADRQGDAAKAAALYAKCAKAAPGTKFGERCERRAKELAEKK